MSDEERDEAGGAYLMTPHRALSLAVHNEERAFALFSNIASMADLAAVREHAEKLAKEELDHVVSLRVKRRRAWRAQAEGAAKSAPRRGVLSLRFLPALLARAISVERDAAERCTALAVALNAAGDTEGSDNLIGLAQNIFELVNDLQQRSNDTTTAEPPENSNTPTEVVLDVLQFGARKDVLSLALADAEDALDFYLAVADAGVSQDMMETAQELAQLALNRFGQIKAWLDHA